MQILFFQFTRFLYYLFIKTLRFLEAMARPRVERPTIDRQAQSKDVLPPVVEVCFFTQNIQDTLIFNYLF